MQLRRLSRDIYHYMPGNAEFVNGIWEVVQALIHWSNGQSDLMFMYLTPDWRSDDDNVD
jgi:hypothetical protein